jgi:uncharacterized protein YggE
MQKLILATAFLAFIALPTSAADLARTITVSGQGKAGAPPDMATVRTGVTTSAPTAKEALAINNQAMLKVMGVLKDRNIDGKDIQTSGFSVYPEYARPQPKPRGGSNRTREVIGYRVSNNVSVKVRNLPRLGEILDSLVQAGSNQISGVSFGISEKRTIMNEARKNAIDDARGRAELYAQATGVKVGKVISISEQSIQPPRPMFQARMAMAEASNSVPIATGEQEVTASINVMYELLD